MRHLLFVEGPAEDRHALAGRGQRGRRVGVAAAGAADLQLERGGRVGEADQHRPVGGDRVERVLDGAVGHELDPGRQGPPLAVDVQVHDAAAGPRGGEQVVQLGQRGSRQPGPALVAAQGAEEAAHLVERLAPERLDARERRGRLLRRAGGVLRERDHPLEVAAGGAVEVARQAEPLDLDRQRRGAVPAVLELGGALHDFGRQPLPRADAAARAPHDGDQREGEGHRGDGATRAIEHGVGRADHREARQHEREAPARALPRDVSADAVGDQQPGGDRRGEAELVEGRQCAEGAAGREGGRGGQGVGAAQEDRKRDERQQKRVGERAAWINVRVEGRWKCQAEHDDEEHDVDRRWAALAHGGHGKRAGGRRHPPGGGPAGAPGGGCAPAGGGLASAHDRAR